MKISLTPLPGCHLEDFLQIIFQVYCFSMSCNVMKWNNIDCRLNSEETLVEYVPEICFYYVSGTAKRKKNGK